MLSEGEVSLRFAGLKLLGLSDLSDSPSGPKSDLTTSVRWIIVVK